MTIDLDLIFEHIDREDKCFGRRNAASVNQINIDKGSAFHVRDIDIVKRLQLHTDAQHKGHVLFKVLTSS
jgi:hypothetical protein